ncbi:MAG: hypothetical protein IKD30_06690 [Peptococcaceae bacterium]|nr:hypothetical protein [Peptococcaceae bacterium]
MRILLLLAAALFSLGIILLACLFLTGALSAFLYTVFSSGISILLIFALFHFIYLYLQKRKNN